MPVRYQDIKPFITISGFRVTLWAPDLTGLPVHDIVHGLCRTFRFNGQTVKPWSVGHHTLALVRAAEAKQYSRRVITLLLLHDFAEFALGDTIKPLKDLRAKLSIDFDTQDLEELLTLAMDAAIRIRFLPEDHVAWTDEEAGFAKDLDSAISPVEQHLAETGHQPDPTCFDPALRYAVELGLRMTDTQTQQALLRVCREYLQI